MPAVCRAIAAEAGEEGKSDTVAFQNRSVGPDVPFRAQPARELPPVQVRSRLARMSAAALT